MADVRLVGEANFPPSDLTGSTIDADQGENSVSDTSVEGAGWGTFAGDGWDAFVGTGRLALDESF